MFELLFLLLPVAAAYGWFMGKRAKTQEDQNRTNRALNGYVEGLNFLLSNNKEQAIDLLLEQLKSEDNHNFETHLTIGNLFRSRGEVNRALHIHQLLLESNQLTEKERFLTQKELAQDYLSSGFYDRAEAILIDLAQEETFEIHALEQLSAIYQSTRDWEKAIECALRLIKLGQTDYQRQIAQFYCELSTQSLHKKQFDRAQILAKKALALFPDCVRASLILGQNALREHDYEHAKTHFMNTLTQNPLFCGESLKELKRCFAQAPDLPRFKLFLMECVQKNVGSQAELMLADLIEQESDHQKARESMRHALIAHPNLKGFCRLIDYYLKDSEQGNAKESLILIKNMVEMQIKALPNYQCDQCGFATKSLYWLCPKCRTWESIRPIQEFQWLHRKNET